LNDQSRWGLIEEDLVKGTREAKYLIDERTR